MYLPLFRRGDTLITASEDGTAKLWDISSGACQSTFRGVNGNKDEVFPFAYAALFRTAFQFRNAKSHAHPYAFPDTTTKCI